ncbi:MAG: DnaB-like helicase terminal domain [Acidimicrobiaceae bacterium]|nr:DnaB-like helicase terminal domain [Acidimicrobiaceae bacterium]
MTTSVTHIPPPGAADTDVDVDRHEPWMATAAEVLAALLDRHGSSGDELVVTGNPAIDKPGGGGLAPGTLTALIGPPGPATTAAVAAAAHHAAHRQAVTTFLYPLRSTLPQLAAHLAHIHAGITVGLLNADPAAAHLAGLARAADDLRRCPLYITIGSPITVTHIHYDALDSDTPPRLIAVDAVTLLHPAGSGRDLKHLALELNVAILCATAVHITGKRPICAADAPPDIAAAADTIIAIQPTPVPGAPAARRRSPTPAG